ncbi:MAG: conjugal transfer protein [Nitrospirales bacterium]|nr:conjugal transfer protein [Nitrospirales bacterium]
MHDDEGYTTPIYQALTRPVLLAGVPRNMAILVWVITTAVGFGMQEIWAFGIGFVLHVAVAMGTRHDPHFFDIVKFTMKAPKRLEP